VDFTLVDHRRAGDRAAAPAGVRQFRCRLFPLADDTDIGQAVAQQQCPHRLVEHPGAAENQADLRVETPHCAGGKHGGPEVADEGGEPDLAGPGGQHPLHRVGGPAGGFFGVLPGLGVPVAQRLQAIPVFEHRVEDQAGIGAAEEVHRLRVTAPGVVVQPLVERKVEDTQLQVEVVNQNFDAFPPEGAVDAGQSQGDALVGVGGQDDQGDGHGASAHL